MMQQWANLLEDAQTNDRSVALGRQPDDLKLFGSTDQSWVGLLGATPCALSRAYSREAGVAPLEADAFLTLLVTVKPGQGFAYEQALMKSTANRGPFGPR